jgi:hypothetical protein
MNRRSDGREVRGNVMFEPVFANVVEQFLQAGYFDDSRATEGF